VELTPGLFLVFVWLYPNSAKRLTAAIPLSLFMHSSKYQGCIRLFSSG
jgi:hypothetical protein